MRSGLGMMDELARASSQPNVPFRPCACPVIGTRSSSMNRRRACEFAGEGELSELVKGLVSVAEAMGAQRGLCRSGLAKYREKCEPLALVKQRNRRQPPGQPHPRAWNFRDRRTVSG